MIEQLHYSSLTGLLHLGTPQPLYLVMLSLQRVVKCSGLLDLLAESVALLLMLSLQSLSLSLQLQQLLQNTNHNHLQSL